VGQLEEQLKEALDILEGMVAQNCGEYDGELLCSGAISAHAEAMRLLAEHGRLVIVKEYGRMIKAKWPDQTVGGADGAADGSGTGTPAD
jgi:hypothetical protein